MPSYLVEGYLPRTRASELAGAAARLRRAAEVLAAEGVHRFRSGQSAPQTTISSTVDYSITFVRVRPDGAPL